MTNKKACGIEPIIGPLTWGTICNGSRPSPKARKSAPATVTQIPISEVVNRMDLPDFDLAALKVAYHLGFEVLLTDELQDQETEKHDLAWRVYLALRDAMREAYIAGVRIESFNGGVRRTQAKARRTSKADR